MRFSHTLQLNAVPEWIDSYVNYDSLKKLIFQLEKENVDEINANEDPEKMLEHKQDGEARFLTALDVQLEKVFDFYTQKESELYAMLDQIDNEIDSNGDLNNDGEYPDTKAHLSPLENLDSTYRFPNAMSEKDDTGYPVERIEQIAPQRRGSRASRASRRPSRQSFESRMSMDHVDDLLMEQLTDLRSQLILLYISLSELESYVELNRTAFEKILKNTIKC
ncbi:unnamed protein product [Mucor fragilis]